MSSMISIPIGSTNRINVPFIVSDELYARYQSNPTNRTIIDTEFGAFDTRQEAEAKIPDCKNILSNNSYFNMINELPAVFYNDALEYGDELLLDLIDFISPNRIHSTYSGSDIYIENYLWATYLGDVSSVATRYINSGSVRDSLTFQQFPIQRTSKQLMYQDVVRTSSSVAFSVIKSSSIVDGKLNFNVEDYPETNGHILYISAGIGITQYIAPTRWYAYCTIQYDTTSGAAFPSALNGLKVLPTEFESLYIKPSVWRARPGETIQYRATLNGEETNDGIVWSLQKVGDYETEFTQLEGVSISETGLVTVDNMTIDNLSVKARSTVYNYSNSALLINANEPYSPGGVSGLGGGNGSFTIPESDRVEQNVPIGTDIGDDSSTGMYTRYLMNTQYMKLFGDWMWNPDAGLSLIKTLYESWYGEKQSDSLVSLLSFPFALTAPLTGIVSQAQPLILGHQNILANYIALKSGGAQIDWGTLNLKEYWGNFLDYSPHTKIELYLPWGTGFVDIDPGQCLPGSLRVVTNIEFARGSCVHNVINQDGCVMGIYMGQPGAMIPMIASDIASKRAGMLIGAVSAAVGGAVVGGASAVSAIGQSASVSAYTTSMSRLPMTMPAASRSAIATGIASQPLNVANEISSNLMPGASLAGRIASDAAIASRRHPAHMTRNGGFGDASAGTMIQYPYVIISRPEQNVPDSYGHHYGYPSNIYEPLANLRGYTEIATIHLNGIGCTASEMSELESILAGGVIF